MQTQIIMESKNILQPVVALMIWTMIMWCWMYATRLPAMNRSQHVPPISQLKGGKGSDLDAILPDHVQWKADNYNHLHEQPTLFYAVALVLAYVGQGEGMNAFIGWIYVGLRVAHSLVQVTANRVLVRFVLFALSSVVLMALIYQAAMVVFSSAL